MTRIMVGNLTFRFPNGYEASKYDDWSFYRNQFQAIANGSKAIDILCVGHRTAWLIEIKDYRRHPRTKPIDIADEVATKVRDTLAGLATAAKDANAAQEHQYARQAMAMYKWRVVLHLEQSATSRRLWSKPIDTAKLLKKLRTRTLKAVDAHPIICDRSTLPLSIPWTVR